MIRFLAFSGILFFCLSSALVRAEQSSLMTVLDLTEVERGYIALDYAYFSESLDVFDFASKLNSTFKPKDAASTFGSIGYKPSSNLLISYQREATSAATTRDENRLRLNLMCRGMRFWCNGELASALAMIYNSLRAWRPVSRAT